MIIFLNQCVYAAVGRVVASLVRLSTVEVQRSLIAATQKRVTLLGGQLTFIHLLCF